MGLDVLPLEIEQQVVRDELAPGSLQGKRRPCRCGRNTHTDEEHQHQQQPGAGTTPCLAVGTRAGFPCRHTCKRPDGKAHEGTGQDEEHLLRTHDGSSEAEAASEEIRPASPRRVCTACEATQQHPQTADEQGESEDVGAHLESLLEKDGLTEKKKSRQETYLAIFPKASDLKHQEDRQGGQDQ